MLAELDATAALRIIRHTRPRGIQTDLEEQVKARRQILATAHEQLGRVVRAQQLRTNL